MKKIILFQGDSITDCGRSRENLNDMGKGYPLFVKAELGYDCPQDYEYVNRGISGNRVVDVYARIKKDFININPDYASIFIGVNDAWHEINSANGVSTPKFEKIYTMLIDEVLEACPNIKLMLIAPFVTPGTATASDEEHPDRYELFVSDVASKAEVTKKLAKKYGFPVIDLQSAFDKALEKAPAEYWTKDGVHPTPAGHELIKRLWLEKFKLM